MGYNEEDYEKKSTNFFGNKEVKVSTSIRKKGVPTPAFVGASWASLFLGVITYNIGLYNATMELNEKGYYLAVLLLGLYSAVSLQKTVRDKDEGIDVTGIYIGITWVAFASAVLLMAVGLWNAGSIIRSEKGFYAMAFVLSLFASVTVQKNIRDTKEAEKED